MSDQHGEDAAVEDHAWVRNWATGTAFAQLLGIRVDELTETEVRLSLPFRKESSNGDGALHGGISASIIATAAGATARAALGEGTGPWHTAALQVSYLAAAIEEGLAARARLLRKGKELAHVEVKVTSQAGKAIAEGLAVVRGRHQSEPATLPTGAGNSTVGSDPGPMGPFIASVPFHAALGLAAEHMAGGRSRITMPAQPATGDGTGTHEGAILALIDTTGAMAAWAETGPGRFKASTPAIAARILVPQPAGGLVGHGRVVHRDRELLFCAVEVRQSRTGALVADGSVDYRIVTPDHAR